MQLLTTKDLANEMLLHPRTVKRWWRKRGVPPRIAGHSCHRWTRADADTLLARWHDYWTAHGLTVRDAVGKFTGADKRAAERRQLTFPFLKKL